MFNYKVVSKSTVGILSILILLGGIAYSGTMEKAENFNLKDYNGKSHSLTDYTDSDAIVIMFIATQCPVSNDYNSRMVKLYEDYKDKNVTILGINSNKQESVEEIAKHAKENGFDFAVLKDDKNIIADKYNAQVTPEIFVVNPDLQILYHGRIDDSRRQSEVTSNDLRQALDEILAGKEVTVPETKAFGCTIKRLK
jgi:peroxiredoxin